MNIIIVMAIAIFAIAGLFIATPMTTAFAMHNDEGHEDKASVGECLKITNRDKELCQDPANKESFKDFRKN